MKHKKRQKLILSTHVHGYNMQFLLYPYIHSPRVDKINICRFICFMNDGPYKFFSFSTIFYAISISDTCLEVANLFPYQISIK